MTGEWLILHGGALGDLVLTIQLALRLPGVGGPSTLRVVSRVNPGDLSAGRPSIVRQAAEGLELHWLYVDGGDPAPERLRELVRGARVLNALAGVDSVVHRRLRLLEPAALYSFEPPPEPGVERHITEQWAEQLAAQGLALAPGGVDFGFSILDFGLGANTAGAQRIRGRAVVHPGSGGRGKCWPLASFVAAARHLRTAGTPVTFVIGPAEVETWPATQLAELAAEFEVVCAPEPDELVAILAAARVFIGNDAGPTHLAALLGTPTVAVFGPTSPVVWRPLGPRVQVIAGDPRQDAETWGIEPEAVAAAAGDLERSERGA